MAKTDARLRFVDTNVLLAATDSSRGLHDRALALLQEGLRGEKSLFMSGQVVREYLVVGTRPVVGNGLGLEPADALANLAEFSRCVSLLEESTAVSERLCSLVARHTLRGKRIHDANIVAVMEVHGLACLATDNPQDFAAYSGISIGW